MIDDLINSILDDLNDLMQDEIFWWDFTNVFERLVLDDLQLKPSNYLRDRIEAERRILRKLDLLRSIREENDNEDYC